LKSGLPGGILWANRHFLLSFFLNPFQQYPILGVIRLLPHQFSRNDFFKKRCRSASARSSPELRTSSRRVWQKFQILKGSTEPFKIVFRISVFHFLFAGNEEIGELTL